MNDTPVAIIGAGGHARVVLDALRSTGARVVALTDLHPERFPDGLDGCRVITDEELVAQFPSDQIRIAYGVASVAAVTEEHPRWRIVERFTKLGYGSAAVVHSVAYVSATVRREPGIQVHAGAVVQPGVTLGAYSIINTRASVDHDCHIGRFCHIAPGATLSGNVMVGEGAHIGTGASVIQGMTIGRGAMVAAGSCVVSDIADYEVVMGVPARPRGVWRNVI